MGMQAEGWPSSVMLIGWAAKPRVPRGQRLGTNPIEHVAQGWEPATFWNLGILLPLNVPVQKPLG